MPINFYGVRFRPRRDGAVVIYRAILFYWVSNGLADPLSGTEVEIGGEQDEVINVVGGPTKGDAGAEPESEEAGISHIDGGGEGDDNHGGAGVARTGDAELVDDGGPADDERREHDP